MDKFVVLDQSVGQITKVAVKRNTKGLFDDWKLQEVSSLALFGLADRSCHLVN